MGFYWYETGRIKKLSTSTNREAALFCEDIKGESCLNSSLHLSTTSWSIWHCRGDLFPDRVFVWSRWKWKVWETAIACFFFWRGRNKSARDTSCYMLAHLLHPFSSLCTFPITAFPSLICVVVFLHFESRL